MCDYYDRCITKSLNRLNPKKINVANRSNLSTPHAISVYYIDDSASQLELAKMYIEKKAPRIEVTSFTSPNELFESLRRKPCDCVISSSRVNTMDIRELAGRIREIAALPIILYTNDDEYDVSDALSSTSISHYVRRYGNLEHYNDLVAAIFKVVKL